MGAQEFEIGQEVLKLHGYPFPGVVVAAFDTLKGHRRYVVECTVEGVAGCLHIYAAKDLIPA